MKNEELYIGWITQAGRCLGQSIADLRDEDFDWFDAWWRGLTPLQAVREFAEETAQAPAIIPSIVCKGTRVAIVKEGEHLVIVNLASWEMEVLDKDGTLVLDHEFDGRAVIAACHDTALFA